MVAESCTEVEMAVEVTEECLTKMNQKVGKLFFAFGETDESPQSRYDHANQLIQQAKILLKLESKYPQLRLLFEKLEASCSIAEERKERFESRNKNLKLLAP